MKSFSYIWFTILFILQVMGLGINLGKLGEEKKTTYSLSSVFILAIVCAMTGFSLIFWPY